MRKQLPRSHLEYPRERMPRPATGRRLEDGLPLLFHHRWRDRDEHEKSTVVLHGPRHRRSGDRRVLPTG